MKTIILMKIVRSTSFCVIRYKLEGCDIIHDPPRRQCDKLTITINGHKMIFQDTDDYIFAFAFLEDLI